MWSEAINAASTFVIAILAFQSWRIANRMTWLTGAMERHSDQQRQIAAKNAGIEMIWWDKNQSQSGQFPHEGEHGQINRLEKLYIGIPEFYRRTPQNQLEFWRQLGIAGVLLGMMALILSAVLLQVAWLWSYGTMGAGFLLFGVGLGFLIKPNPK